MPQVMHVRYVEPAQLKLVTDETNDQRADCFETERRQRIEVMLQQLPMSVAEQQFVINTAEKMVDMACDDYARARKSGELNPQCIAAAATVAMMIVDDG